ncbi:MAG: hypothetical protein KA226_09000 [Gemmatimonadales bacterium]|nr:hypothetical protein [Gemmatimonadales bacterium]
MKCTTCVVLAGALLCSTRTLSAQSAVPPTVAALAGCYALTLGPWQQQYAGGAASWQTLPPVIRLDTTLAWRVPGWRSLGPTPTQYTRYGPGISPAWRVSPTDSVEAFWSTGFVGTRLKLAVRGDTLIGGAEGFTDALGGQPDPTATARAVRMSCPAGVQRVTADSAVVRTVMEGVYGQLAGRLASETRDSTSRAWEFEVPSEDSVLYEVHRRNLMRIVHGRAPTEADVSIASVGIDPIAIRGDTIDVRFSIGAAARCASGVLTAGPTTWYRLVAVRRGSVWGPPTVTAEAVGDRVCIARRPVR